MPDAPTSSDKISTYRDFWPFYLGEHSKSVTRGFHYFGTSLAIAFLVIALATQIWWLLIIVPIAGYLFAWVSHFGVEHNRPATFTYPTWSLYSDFRMLFVWITGGMGRELDRYKIR